MKNRSRAWIGISTAALIAGAGAVGLGSFAAASGESASTEVAAGAWSVDPVHSHVIFKIRHLGVSNAYGMIHEPTGSFAIEGGSPSFDITLKADKVDTGNEKRDQHIRSGDFFGAKEFPEIKFKSTSVKSAGEGKFEIVGDLTFRGQTKPVTAQLVTIGTGKGMKGEERIGVEATFSFKRTDFGNKTYVAEGALGDDVSITVALEGSAKQ